jgi:transposase
MDIWKAFKNSTLNAEHAPQAKILFDKFHILSHQGEAFNQVRKDKYRRLAGRQREYIKGQKFTLPGRKLT